MFQLINFGVLVFVLNRFLYQPILKIIELRNKKIEDSIKAAEETLKEKLSKRDFIIAQADLRKAVLELKVAKKRRRYRPTLAS